MGRLPNLFLAGFQKCATTSLFQSLVLHPDISGPTRATGIGSTIVPKEVQFFNLNFPRALEEYEAYFDGAQSRYLIDGSPNYLCRGDVLAKLHEAIAAPRFIVSLRDPVSRLFSAWNHWQQLPKHERWAILRPGGSLRENIEAELSWLNPLDPVDGLVGTGLYGVHLERALSLFSRDQFHVTTAEWLEDAYHGEIQRIFRFLELPERPVRSFRAHSRRSAEQERDPRLERFLRDFYREDHDRLRNLLAAEIPWPR